MANVPVLFVHAFPFDGRMWAPQLASLEPGRLALAPDLRGLGRNQGGPLLDTVEQHAQDLLDQLDAAGVSKTVVVGLSMGGYIALALQRLAPHRLAGLLLADTKAEPDTPEARRGRDQRIDEITRSGLASLPDAMMPSLVGPSCSDDLKQQVRRIMLDQKPQGVIAALRALRDRPDATETLASIKVPVMLVVGEHDKLTPLAGMQAMADRIPNARLRTLPGVGHLTNLEAPEAFNQTLAELLRWVEAG